MSEYDAPQLEQCADYPGRMYRVLNQMEKGTRGRTAIHTEPGR